MNLKIPMFLCVFWVSAFIGIISLVYRKYAPHLKLENFPKENYKYHIIKDILTEKEFHEVLAIAKKITYKMTTRAAIDYGSDEKNYGSTPISEDGTCPHPLLRPNGAKTKCTLPQRIDVGMHFAITGGSTNRKEQYEDLIPRLTVFQHFFRSFHLDTFDEVPQIERVLHSKDYIKKAQDICDGHKITEKIQLSLVVNIPGQELGTHYDTPWFIGADKKHFPNWVLTCMDQSGLYEDIVLKQTQGVTYLHEWNDYDEKQGGFYFYPEGLSGKQSVIQPVTNQAFLIDGTRCPHGTQPFLPNESTGMVHRQEYTIAWNGTYWEVFDHKGNLFNSFEEKDIRISMVWREKCFKDEAQRTLYHNTKSNRLNVYTVINRLKEDLIQRKLVKSFPDSEVEVAEILIKHYIKYPYPLVGSFPYNYCLLDKVLGKWVKPLLNHIC